MTRKMTLSEKQQRAKDPQTPIEVLRTLAKRNNCRALVAANPNCDAALLCSLAMTCPIEVIQNPMVVFIGLKDPAFFRELARYILRLPSRDDRLSGDDAELRLLHWLKTAEQVPNWIEHRLLERVEHVHQTRPALLYAEYCQNSDYVPQLGSWEDRISLLRLIGKWAQKTANVATNFPGIFYQHPLWKRLSTEELRMLDLTEMAMLERSGELPGVLTYWPSFLQSRGLPAQWFFPEGADEERKLRFVIALHTAADGASFPMSEEFRNWFTRYAAIHRIWSHCIHAPETSADESQYQDVLRSVLSVPNPWGDALSGHVWEIFLQTELKADLTVARVAYPVLVERGATFAPMASFLRQSFLSQVEDMEPGLERWGRGEHNAFDGENPDENIPDFVMMLDAWSAFPEAQLLLQKELESRAPLTAQLMRLERACGDGIGQCSVIWYFSEDTRANITLTESSGGEVEMELKFRSVPISELASLVERLRAAVKPEDDLRAILGKLTILQTGLGLFFIAPPPAPSSKRRRQGEELCISPPPKSC